MSAPLSLNAYVKMTEAEKIDAMRGFLGKPQLSQVSRVSAPSAKAQTVTLPAPPSANRYWRVVKGRAVKSREARAYASRIAHNVRGVVGLPQGKPVVVEVRWSRRRRMGDLDNRLKVVIDALKGIGWADDKQIVELHAYRVDGGDDTVTVTWWAA